MVVVTGQGADALKGVGAVRSVSERVERLGGAVVVKDQFRRKRGTYQAGVVGALQGHMELNIKWPQETGESLPNLGS